MEAANIMTTDTFYNDDSALLIVDLQKDFCRNGLLEVADADAIIPEINGWILQAQVQKIPIYASRDWHPKNHVSFLDEGGDWPPHCIQDSDGAKFHPDLELPSDAVVVTKGVRFDHDQNSVFDDTGLAYHFRKKNIKELYVCGLALDVCVLDSVLDALKEGFGVVLITTATRPVDKEKARLALSRMREAGAVLTQPDAFGTLIV